MQEGIILKGIAGFYYVKVKDGRIIECKARGKFRSCNLTPVVGDRVFIEEIDNNSGVIKEIMDRKNLLIRPFVANIDQAIVVFAAKKPDIVFSLLDKLLIQIEHNNIEAVICINKSDLDDSKIIDYIKEAMLKNIQANDIVDNYLIKAINRVGDLYERKIYFLPQLIVSAEVMKKAFSYIEPFLIKKEESDSKKIKIVFATVKGDIHDIGKNIVILMLKNYGFDVIDLGKDVPSELIVDTAIKENAQVIGLSALMTTTMVEMKKVIQLAKEKNLNCKIIIGGAVITEDYAKEIGADGYSKDSIGAVKLVKSLFGLG